MYSKAGQTYSLWKKEIVQFSILSTQLEQKDLLQQTFGGVRLLYNETLTIHKVSMKLE